MDEEWRAVRGWEGWYEVSTLGRCRTIRRGQKSSRYREIYPIILAPLIYRKGYLKYALGSCDNTRQRRRSFAHRLVYEAFHGPIPAGLTVNHIDGNPQNNRLENLELATYQEQTSHARRIGLCRWNTSKGPTGPQLTAEHVREIRRSYAAGEATYEQLAHRFGVVKGTIGHILAQRYWRHI